LLKLPITEQTGEAPPRIGKLTILHYQPGMALQCDHRIIKFDAAAGVGRLQETAAAGKDLDRIGGL
jgi:hypothetical protein